MNYSIIFRLLSIMLTAMGLAFALSAGVAWLYANEGREGGAIFGFGVSVGVAWILALLAYLCSFKAKLHLLRKEAMCSIGLGWLVASMIGAIPYALILDCSLADALFESSSGLTTTGATVLSGLDELPRSLLFWRAISQWIGALGIVAFFVILLPFVGGDAKVLFTNESTVEVQDLQSSRVRGGVLQLIYLYLGLSLLAFLAFRLCGMTWYEAICHMFTTVATGGFSLYDESVAYFNSPLIEWVFIVFMLAGAMNFLVLLHLLKGNGRPLYRNTETRFFYTMVLGSTLLITALVWQQDIASTGTESNSLWASLRLSFFQVVSITTTSGFATTDFDVWPQWTHFLLLALMIIGGSSGSTAGGLKVIRLAVAVKVIRVAIEGAFRNHVIRLIKVNGRQLSDAAKESILVYIVLIAIISHLSLLILAGLEPELSFKGLYSASIAMLNNIGPGLQEVGPSQTYAGFKDVTKYFFSLLMIMGRLEFYVILVLFLPSLWKRFK